MRQYFSRNRIPILLIAVSVLCIAACFAPALVIIELKNNESYKGKIAYEDEEKVILEHAHRGYMTFKRSDIKRITPVTEEEKPPEPKPKPHEPEVKKETVPGLPAPDPEVHEQVKTLLAQLKGEKPASPGEVIKQIAEMESPAILSLLHLLSEMPEKDIGNVIVIALVQLRDDKTISYLILFFNSESEAVRAVVVRVLEVFGDSEAVKALLKALSSKATGLSGTAAKTIGNVLRKQDNNYELFELLDKAAAEAGSSLRSRIMTCLGLSKSRLAIPILLKYLNEWEELSVKRSCIISLGMLGFNELRVCKAIRKFLRNKDDQLRKAAALALGKLQDLESVEDLIELLNDENKGVRGNVYWSLKQITGRRFPLNYERWKDWWDKESEKIKVERDALLAQLRSGTKGQIVDAIGHLVRIELGKKEIANTLLEYMDYGYPEVRKKVCLALGRIGAKEAVPALIERLDDADQSVAKAAHASLRAITAKNLPPDKEAWEKHLSGGN